VFSSAGLSGVLAGCCLCCCPPFSWAEFPVRPLRADLFRLRRRRVLLVPPVFFRSCPSDPGLASVFCCVPPALPSLSAAVCCAACGVPAFGCCAVLSCFSSLILCHPDC